MRLHVRFEVRASLASLRDLIFRVLGWEWNLKEEHQNIRCQSKAAGDPGTLCPRVVHCSGMARAHNFLTLPRTSEGLLDRVTRYKLAQTATPLTSVKKRELG